MRVMVDRMLCEANAVCASLAPQVFDVDDDDQLLILVEEVPPGLADSVRLAVGACPKTALRVQE